MKQYTLIDIKTQSNNPPNLINHNMLAKSSQQAALLFMAYAFSGKSSQIKATLTIRNFKNQIFLFKVMRMPFNKNGKTFYKHFII